MSGAPPAPYTPGSGCPPQLKSPMFSGPVSREETPTSRVLGGLTPGSGPEVQQTQCWPDRGAGGLLLAPTPSSPPHNTHTLTGLPSPKDKTEATWQERTSGWGLRRWCSSPGQPRDGALDPPGSVITCWVTLPEPPPSAFKVEVIIPAQLTSRGCRLP